MEIASTKSRGNPNWKAGVSGNPAGRPMASRQKLGEKLIADLADVWQRRGGEIFERLANDDPATLAKLGVSVLPKELFLSVQPKLPGNLDPASWQTLRRVIDMIEAYAPAGAEPLEVFETVERALVAAYEAPPEHQPALPPPPYGAGCAHGVLASTDDK